MKKILLHYFLSHNFIGQHHTIITVYFVFVYVSTLPHPWDHDPCYEEQPGTYSIKPQVSKTSLTVQMGMYI